jgi:hypothetical protein
MCGLDGEAGRGYSSRVSWYGPSRLLSNGAGLRRCRGERGRVVQVRADATAVLDPLDLVGEEMGLVADDVNRWRDPRALRQGRG